MRHTPLAVLLLLILAACSEHEPGDVIERGILLGGFTIRVQRARMTPAERAQFDESVPFEFGD